MTVASADELSRDVRAYLQQPDKLFRRVRDEHGQLVLSKAAKAYHPGRGVYRSSYKNARRLASTETNIAYHKADKKRWEQLDFVVGFEVVPSKNHPEPDICDDLKGIYPKTFDFSGWHPHCRCHTEPIMKTVEEMERDNAAILAGGEPSAVSVNTVGGVPSGFLEWVKLNGAKIGAAKSLPYFVRDNRKLVDGILNPAPSALEVAKERHAARTPEQVQAIRKQWVLHEAAVRHAQRTPEQSAAIRKEWNDRKATLQYGANILKIMGGISDVSTAALSSALQGGRMSVIMTEAAKLKAVGKQIYALDKIGSPMAVAKQFSFADAKAVNNAVEAKLAQFVGLSPDEQVKKIQVEVKYVTDPTYLKPHKLYPTAEVAKNAYTKAIHKIEKEKHISELKTKLEEIKKVAANHPKATTLPKIISAIEISLKQGDIEVSEKQLKVALKKADKLGSKDPYSEARKNAAIWCKSSQKSHELWDNETAEIIKTASKEEKDGLYYYTEGSGHMNRPLRGYLNSWSKFIGVGKVKLNKEYGETHIRGLYSLIDRSSHDKDVWLQRGVETWEGVEGFVGVKGLKKENLSQLVGKEIIDWAFTSCGSAKGTGFSGTIFNIYCPKGTKMIYAAPNSAYPGENETILQLGTKFRITKVEVTPDKRVFFDLEVIGSETHPLL